MAAYRPGALGPLCSLHASPGGQELSLWKETRKHKPVPLSPHTGRVNQWVRAEGLGTGHNRARRATALPCHRADEAAATARGLGLVGLETP